jgi:hypothetical protein
MNMDIGFLTETKLQGNHTVYTMGIKCSNRRLQGVVALVYRDKSTNFHIKGTRQFGNNVIQAILVSGRKKWRLVRAYIPPSEVDGSTIAQIQAVIAVAMHLPLILLRDLNICIIQHEIEETLDQRIMTQ